MHVGGGEGRLAAVRGIHWHANPGTRVEYIATDETRQTIPYVKVTAPDGTVREYKAEGASSELVSSGTRRRMECMDCHNRAGHPTPATLSRAVNEALERNAIPATLPFVHREAAKALTASYPSEDAALAGISTTLKAFYQTQPAAGRRSNDRDRAGAVPPQRGPGNECEVRHLSRQRRPRRFPGLFPLPRRRAQDIGWPGHRPGLRNMPRDRVTGVPPPKARHTMRWLRRRGNIACGP